jgi:Peptidase M16C associated
MYCRRHLHRCNSSSMVGFCRALTQMGTEKESFIELTERIGRKTGGLSVYPFTSSVQGSPEPVAFLMVGADPAVLADCQFRCVSTVVLWTLVWTWLTCDSHSLR